MVRIKKKPQEVILKIKKEKTLGKVTPPTRTNMENQRKGDPKSEMSASFSNQNLVPKHFTTLQSVKVGNTTKRL